MKKFLYFLIAFLGLSSFAFAVDANDLLPPEQAFVPQVNVTDQGVSVKFKIADGYYMYQSKIVAATDPDKVLGEPKFSKGEEKEDEFFGKQTVYHHTAQVDLPYKQAAPQYKLTLTYQGCAEAGVCYPPVDTEFDVKGNGVYQPQSDEPVSAKDRFLQPSASSDGQMPTQPATNNPDSSRFKLSWDTLNANLLAFFCRRFGLKLYRLYVSAPADCFQHCRGR